MKTFFIIISVLLTVNLSSNELSWVNEQVEAIKPPRIGMKNRELSIVKDPFIFLKKNRVEEVNKNSSKKLTSGPTYNKVTSVSNGNKKTVKKKAYLSVSMLMNSSALINGKWYKVGDKVKGYKVSKIDGNSVLLTKKSKNLLLSTKSKSKNLNFKNK
ncbi:MAG: hypothetical protein U9Q40_02915 [Campylobacterota bacterium]|nr:hypothetical protein [Campylobacterota bacterium]